MENQLTTDNMKSDIFQVDKALESWRDSGFDLSSAVGEVVDNSIEASSKIVKIVPYYNKKDKSIETIVFADDGVGINPDILAQTLKIGFSTRYNQRKGLGRFGVGMKVAALSQGRRIDIYTKPFGEDRYYHAYLDLDLIASEEQTHIIANEIEGFPAEYAKHMAWEDGASFESGTLIVWSKIDRLVNEGKYGNSVSETIQDLTKFLARAYRKFIDKGLVIQLDGKNLDLYDPLMLLDSPRITKLVGENNIPADIIDESIIKIDNEDVTITVSVLPEVVRRVKGEGGYKGSASRFKELYLKDRDGKISILRNGREIYYDPIQGMFPSRIENIDRFIGVEISFTAQLDEYFQVRNVKRGAVPVGKLRAEIRKKLDKPIRAARKQIQELFVKTSIEQRKSDVEHTPATKAVIEAEKTSIPGRAALNTPESIVNETIQDILEDAGLDKTKDKELADKMTKQINEQPITLVDSSWPGKELMDITHFNGKAVVKLNHRHPFIKEIYNPIKEAANQEPSNINPDELIDLARKVESAIDVLFMAYAKAENMHMNPDEVYSDLRTQWGIFSGAYVRELLKTYS
ncbi:ATP-binding protein [Bacillus cabrialesii]|uniref:ATP-binding protein n=1 Tax=Bacillus cabrialesii subsp. tritici TaxID=2944916 RepID=A0ABT9DGY1_9BACI|nr:ATP-binding protein [Bacillus cabrialesii]MDO8223942.1 ATP-binding protein [Bacillus cabrialesii subsp. tritici]